MDSNAYYSPAMGPVMEEDCFLTMARSIVDDILCRYGVEIREDAEQEIGSAPGGYRAFHTA